MERNPERTVQLRSLKLISRIFKIKTLNVSTISFYNSSQANGGGGSGANAVLKERIKSYLENNKSSKYIDIEAMSKSLHTTFPEYNRRKFKVFRTQVDNTFKVLMADMKKKGGPKKVEAPVAPAPVSSPARVPAAEPGSVGGDIVARRERPISPSGDIEEIR